MSIKLDRLNHILTEEISKVISEEVKDTDVQFVTITAVDISSDLSYAKVYFTNLIDKDREKVTKALNNASSFIRGKLFGRVEIRKMPELTFVYDESIEYGNKIEKIIEEINNLIDLGKIPSEGELVLYSKWEPCPSCYYVISQFIKKYPNINFKIMYNKEYGDG